MTRRLFLTSLGSAFVLRGQIGVTPHSPVELKPSSDPKFQVGEVWEYQTRPGEERSRFIVVKVEASSELGIIVHIGVDHLTWKSCSESPFAQHIPHMPFRRSAVDTSATRRVGANRELPDYTGGYQQWREAFLAGHAGVYTIPIRDAVSAAEQTWRTGMGCGDRTKTNKI